jgi:hypothetical protein
MHRTLTMRGCKNIHMLTSNTKYKKQQPVDVKCPRTICIDGLSVRIHVDDTSCRASVHGFVKSCMKVKSLKGCVTISDACNSVNVYGTIDVYNFDSDVLYRGIIYYDGGVKYSMSTKPLMPLCLEFNGMVIVNINGLIFLG